MNTEATEVTEVTFDMFLAASITVKCSSVSEGRAELVRILDCADTNFGAYSNGDPCTGEVSLRGLPSVGLVNGDTEGAEDAPDDLRAMADALLEILKASQEGESYSLEDLEEPHLKAAFKAARSNAEKPQDVFHPQYDAKLMAAVDDLGFEVRKDTESDYYMWSALHHVEDSAATFDTPEEAAESCINTFGEGV